MIDILWGALLVVALLNCIIVPLVLLRTRRKKKVGKKASRRSDEEACAYAFGMKDVYQGWIQWAITIPEEDLESYEEWVDSVEMKETRRSYWSPTPMGDKGVQLKAVLDQHPSPDWDIHDLRQLMNDLQSFTGLDFNHARQVSDRIRLAAGMINDLRDDTYDPGQAPATGTYAYHEKASVRAAYLAGRGKGTECIMDAVTAARTRTREVAGAGESLAAASERHAAALRALRETNQTTAARDAHADFERQLGPPPS